MIPHADLLLLLACLFGFFMAWGVGANDVANAMGTSVGSKALTIKQAIVIAVVFEALGAMLAGGQVTDTIRSSIIHVDFYTHSKSIFMFGMLSALLAAGTWLMIATYFAWPVSTTHTIVGALVGFGVVSAGVHAIQWSHLINIVLSWIVTPIISGAIAYALFRSVQELIFESKNPIRRAKYWIPVYIFLVSMVLTLVTLVSGLKHLNITLSTWQNVELSVLISLIASALGVYLLNRIRFSERSNSSDHHADFEKLERVFSILMIFTACAMAFAHGSNDVANAIGPLAAVVDIAHHASLIRQQSGIPLWVLGLGALGIVFGLATYGHRVIATIGDNITQLTPSRGFAAQLATASTVIIASGIGLPISTTQTLVGAVFGVGLARGMGALNLSVIGNIFVSWVITVPAGALLAIIYFFILKWSWHFL